MSDDVISPFPRQEPDERVGNLNDAAATFARIRLRLSARRSLADHIAATQALLALQRGIAGSRDAKVARWLRPAVESTVASLESEVRIAGRMAQ